MKNNITVNDVLNTISPKAPVFISENFATPSPYKRTEDGEKKLRQMYGDFKVWKLETHPYVKNGFIIHIM